MDKKVGDKVIITDADWKRLNFHLLISSTYSVMRSMIVRWIKSLGIIRSDRKQITISDVNELASYVCIDNYIDRRNMIIIWLKRFGIPVIGRRDKDNKAEYERMEEKLRSLWGKPWKQSVTKLMDRDSR